MLTLSWIWASLTIVCTVLLAHYRGFKHLIDREDAFFLILQAGILTNLLIVPLDLSSAAAAALLEFTTETRVSVLLLSFGIVGTLWFLWKLYDFPAAFERESQISEDNRSSLVYPIGILLIVVIIALCPLLALRDSLPDLLMLHGFVGVLAGMWFSTGSAFLCVTLR